MAPGRLLAEGVLELDALGAVLLAFRRTAEAPALALGPRERALLDTLAEFPLRQAEWRAGRQVAKQALQQRYGLEPSRVEILPAPSGAPLLYYDGALHPELELNLSHTRSWAVAAVAAFSVGVDVADDEDGARLPRISRRVFSAGEAEECGAHESIEHLAAVWAMKEASLKLRIGGVFSPGAQSVRVRSISPPRVADEALELALFRLPGAAVAVARERARPT